VEGERAPFPAHLPTRAQSGHVRADDLRHLRSPALPRERFDRQTYEERRHELVNLGLDGSTWTTCEAFEDGRALFAAVCELGYEGVVAKDRDSQYGSNEGGWVKIKNPGYWRRDAEIEGMQRSRQRRRGAAWGKTI
jgi:ATP-dependent DNA ligase